MAEETQAQPKPVRPPLGTLSSRCDDKGRLRLPKEVEQWLRSLPDTEFFVTTLDGVRGKVYPLHIWLKNLEAFASYKKNPRAAEDIARRADYFGSVAEIDAQGRILVSPQLRRRLEIENAPCHLRYYRGGIEIYSQKVLDASLANADAISDEVLPDMLAEGVQ